MTFDKVVLAFFDNLGGVLPDESDGFKILDAKSQSDIRDGFSDYADMWQDFLIKKKIITWTWS